jgi:hypothetical protein
MKSQSASKEDDFQLERDTPTKLQSRYDYREYQINSCVTKPSERR